MLSVLWVVSAVHAQAPTGDTPKKPVGAESAASTTEAITDAERISRLQRTIADAQKQIDDARAKINDPKSEYKKAETEFGDLDRQVEDKKKAVQKARDERDPNVDTLANESADLEKRRTLARERFDLAIKERKALQDQVALLEQKLQQDQDALNKLLGVQTPKPAGDQSGTQPGSGAIAPTAAPGAQAQPAPGQPAAPTTITPTTQPATPATGGGTEPAPPAVVQPSTGAPVTGQPAPDAAAATTTGASKAAPSPKLIQAQEEATTKQAEAQEAKQEAQSITERLESLRKAIANERELRKTAKQKAVNARETLAALNAELEKKWGEGSTWNDLKDLRHKIDEAEKRVAETENEIRDRAEQIDARHSELTAIQNEQIAAMRDAEEKAKAAEAAQKKVETLKNPFTPQNILQWLIDHGPRLVFTFVTMVFLLWVSKVLEHRLVALMVRHGTSGSSNDRENRAKTLVSVLRNATTVIVLVGGTLMILAEFGVNIVPLVGAAGVVGLAVAFGAQNMIRDYFSGFMILMENQYTVNDVIRVGGVGGQVERITLRITVLRDFDGTVHFVPHGQIDKVSNLTHGWSRALFDIGVAYKEDADRVMKVLMDLGKEMRRDPAYRDFILDDPEMAGLDNFGDSAIVIRFVIKTRPLKQWIVRREMNRRIKKKFDELGIEIPFPHRTVYHRYEANGEGDAALRDQAGAWPESRTAKS